jgi:hypothetical protein
VDLGRPWASVVRAPADPLRRIRSRSWSAGHARTGWSGTGVAGNERAEQAFLPLLYRSPDLLRLVRVVAARWRPWHGNVLVEGGSRGCPGSCRGARLAHRRRPGSADHREKALVIASLPIVVPGHTAMDKSRRNHAVGRTVALQGGFSVMSRSPGSKRPAWGRPGLVGECLTAPAWR